MKTLALCMIVKNEEAVLERCLQCVHGLVDEIIIVDTGSTDKTIEIAKKYTNKIYHFPWQNDFAMARNYSFSKATTDYILWLDADDIILEEEKQKLISLKQSLNGSVDCYFLKYDMNLANETQESFYFYRERILKNNVNFYWKDSIHEYMVVSGNIVQLDITITHKKEHKEKKLPYRNLFIYCNSFAKKGNASPREIYYCARELYDNHAYSIAIQFLEYFLRQKKGWKEDKICACLLLSDAYAKQKQKNKQLQALYKSFAYSSFRPEICCAIGNIFMDNQAYTLAIFWYKLALRSAEEGKKSVFYCVDFSTFIPYMQLSVCFDRLKDYKQAAYYNTLAGAYKPYNKNYLHNKVYFEKILNCKGEKK